MSPKSMPVEVRITDMDDFKRIVADLEKQIKAVIEERDHWQERYEELLAECGGAWPG